MGNEVASLQKSVEIDEKTTQVTDNWSMYSGECRNAGEGTTKLSLFKGEISEDVATSKLAIGNL